MHAPRASLRSLALAALLALAATSFAVAATDGTPPGAAPLPLCGRWDVTVSGPGYEHPAWFEITESPSGLAMRFVGAFGSVTEVPYVSWDGRNVEFQFGTAHRWRGTFNGRWFAGSTGGENESWTAVRAPRLPVVPVRWGQPVRLFDGRTLAGWRTRHAGSVHGWTVRDGALANTFPGDDLVSLETFSNFKLSLQFRLQPQSDSGVHLRGRYEVQLTDRPDPADALGVMGSVYGRLAPSQTVACKAGDWNSLEVTLVGREVTVVLNSVTILDRAIIDGITGDALDSHEGQRGPIMLQGYIGRVDFRNIEVVPAL